MTLKVSKLKILNKKDLWKQFKYTYASELNKTNTIVIVFFLLFLILINIENIENKWIVH